MDKSYVELIIELNKEHRSNPFTDSALLLYHAILARFNDTGSKNKPWKRYVKINNQVLRGDIRKSYNTYKEALNILKEREMIDYRSKNGYREIILSLEPIPENVTASDKISNDGNSILYKSTKAIANPDEQTPTAAAPASPERSSGAKGGVIRRQPPSNSPPPQKLYSIDGDHPPDDGLNRNWEALKRRLSDLNSPPDISRKVVQWSNYGLVGHKVWEVLNKIRDDKGIKMPIEFLVSKMNNSS
jgi:hypothetical protein